jgi:hypothetical protein
MRLSTFSALRRDLEQHPYTQMYILYIPYTYIHPIHIQYVHPSSQTYIRPHTHVYILYTLNTYIHPHTHMYKHPTHIHTYKLLPQRQKSANSRFFSFALGAFAFFRAFFSSRSRTFFKASRSRARKRKSAKKGRVPSSAGFFRNSYELKSQNG